MDKGNDEKTGYRKPPVHTRWKKGQSGNPRGREKGHKGIKTDLANALNTINTLENKLTGKKVKGRHQELAIQRLVERAALGDLKAQALMFPMVIQILGTEDRNYGPRKLSAQDQAILLEVLGEAAVGASDHEPYQEVGGDDEAPATNDNPDEDDGDEENS